MSNTIPNPIEEEQKKKSAALLRYHAALHAMQSGVAVQMAMQPAKAGTDPKHLRVGVNSAMVEHSALASLLLKKHVITELEYFEALAEMAEAEQRKYEDIVGHSLA